MEAIEKYDVKISATRDRFKKISGFRYTGICEDGVEWVIRKKATRIYDYAFYYGKGWSFGQKPDRCSGPVVQQVAIVCPVELRQEWRDQIKESIRVNDLIRKIAKRSDGLFNTIPEWKINTALDWHNHKYDNAVEVWTAGTYDVDHWDDTTLEFGVRHILEDYLKEQNAKESNPLTS